METVDTQAKAQKLNDSRKDLAPLNVYLQINTSGEGQKSGLSDGALIISVAKHIVDNCPKLVFLGLMTIGSLSTSVSSGENQDFKVCPPIFFYVKALTFADLGCVVPSCPGG